MEGRGGITSVRRTKSGTPSVGNLLYIDY